MLKLNQILEAFDPVEATQHETGLFRFQSPGGEVYQAKREPNQTGLTSLVVSQPKGKGGQSQVQPWTITKIAEIRADAPSG